MKKLFTSRTRLPKLEEYVKYLKPLWKSHWLTNDGVYVKKLEKKLEKYWGVKHVVLVDHGTTALLLAVKIMNLKKVYVTPYTFVATVGSVVWAGVKPEFVDIGEEYHSPALVTHVYGAPQWCDAKHVIYDASHAFATKVDGESVMTWGDISIVSLHAVKIFQTVEGGAFVTNNDEYATKARWMRNHGFNGEYSFHGAGMNGKMSEFHAAMGLCSLKMIPSTVKRYKEIIKMYNEGLGLERPDCLTYYPLEYENEKRLLKAIEIFGQNGINAKRYFYPSLNKVFGGKKCPMSEALAKCVLCLPLYYDLTNKEVKRIIKVAKLT
jgi:dTDP-4-amino-4,6-dideoxygalactose transaminase